MSSSQVTVTDISIGSSCKFDILDELGNVLLERGETLTQEFVDSLVQRGIDNVFVAREGVADISLSLLRDSNLPLSARRVLRNQEGFCEERQHRFQTKLEKCRSQIEQVGKNFQQCSNQQIKDLRNIPTQLAEMLLEDGDQTILASVGLDQALATRCVNLSTHAMAIGLEMELSEEDLLLLGEAGLLHDLGMFLLPAQLRDPKHTLSISELEEYRSHPEMSATLLRDFYSVPEEVLVLIRQVHELADGTGFPRGIKKNRFHRLTNILSVVEVFLSLVGPAPGRPPLVAHDAIAFMLYQCKQGVICNKVMRAFLSAFSLYGLNSDVLLESGETATVLRRDGLEYDLPIVRLSPDNHNQVLRLSESSIKIVSPVRYEHQMQLKRDLMSALSVVDLLTA